MCRTKPNCPIIDDSARVVVTGVGIVSSLGIGRENFWRAFDKGDSGIGKLTHFETPSEKHELGGEIRDFDLNDYLAGKGFRRMSRATQLLLLATHLAFVDRGEEIRAGIAEDIGLIVGLCVGSVETINDFDQITLKEGPQYTSPMDFPKTVWNSSAGTTAVHFGLGGVNSTIATGFTAGHDAIGCAVSAIRSGRASVVATGGVEQLSSVLLSGARHSGVLAETTNVNGLKSVGSGMILGEAACILILESKKEAQNNGRRILGEVVGYATGFDPTEDAKARGVAGWENVIRTACAEAQLSTEEIDYVSLQKSGFAPLDLREEKVLNKIFPIKGSGPIRQSIKFSLGETLGASGALQTAATLKILAENRVPVLPEYYSAINTKAVGGESSEATGTMKAALVNGGGCSGRSSALILKRWKQ